MSDVLTTTQLLKKFKAQYGDDIGGKGMKLPPCPRLPSGLLAFDIATGGGIPMSRMSIIYGPESSGKTNLALCLIREHQKRYPKKSCIFIDIEVALDTEWAEKLGVDTEALIVLHPDYAEQAVDLVTEFLTAPDCGLIVIDSIAAMSTMAEIEKSAEGFSPGTHGLAVGKLVRKTTRALMLAKKGGHMPTLVWINQIRYKIGVMFGNPETLPGGQAQLFMASLRVRLYGKNLMDPAVSKDVPAMKETTGIIHKWKHPIAAQKFKYKFATLPHKGIARGYANDWPVAKQYLMEFELLTKVKGGWEYDGKVFETQSEFWEWMRCDHRRMDGFRDYVIGQLIDNDLNTGEAAGGA